VDVVHSTQGLQVQRVDLGHGQNIEFGHRNTPENQIINNTGRHPAGPAFGQRYPASSKKQHGDRKAN
jgi:hypothetical protein